MIQDDDIKMLTELNRIVAQYDGSSITRLADAIRDLQRAEELAFELDRIVQQYGPDSITRLTDIIRNPQRSEELATILEALATRSRPRKSRSRPRKTTPRPQRSDRIGMGILNELRSSDTEKHSLIAQLRRNLISGSILRSMEDLRRFSTMHGLSIGTASSRNAAIVPLLRSVSELPNPEIREIIDSITQYKDDDRSLSRWRNMIVNPGRASSPDDKKPDIQ